MLVILLVVLCAGLSSGACPRGYFSVVDQCYKVITSDHYYTTNISSAENVCASDGGHLVSFHSAEVEQAVMDALPEPRLSFAIGLQCESRTECAWTDGSPYDYDNFHGNFNLRWGRCTFISISETTHYWGNQHCFSYYMYMCQAPAHADRCTGGYAEFDEECIIAKSAPLTETDAETECISEGGHLASAHKSGASFYDDLAAKAGITTDLYIGLQYDAPSKTYSWKDGSEVGETNWANGFPLHYFGDCVRFLRTDMTRPSGQWTNIPCSTKLPYFCERSIPESA